MPGPTLPVLGGATVNRKWICEVNTSLPNTPQWAPIGGLTNFVPNFDQANMVGDTDQAGQGFESSTKTGATWSAVATVKRAPKSTDVTSYDTAQEYLRTHAIGVFGNANRVQIRVYEYDPNDPNGLAAPRVEAYTGFVSVAWATQGGDMLAEDMVQITMQGQGALTPVTHPYPVTPLVPTVTAVNPSAISTTGGALVVITGTGFTGTVPTTGVKFGATNATSWVVVSDSEIVAVAPAHTAGTAQVVVTNAAGASTSAVNATYS